MIVPDVGSTSRLIIFSVVVLPQPDGPTSATISPSATSSDRSVTAGAGGAVELLVHVDEGDRGRAAGTTDQREPTWIETAWSRTVRVEPVRQTALSASITARQRSGSRLYGA